MIQMEPPSLHTYIRILKFLFLVIIYIFAVLTLNLNNHITFSRMILYSNKVIIDGNHDPALPLDYIDSTPIPSPQQVMEKIDIPKPSVKVDIKYIEELKKLGFYQRDFKDDYLNKRNAILHFQCNHNIMTDGIWGKQSFSTLNKRLNTPCFTYPDNVTNPPSQGKWITINKTKRILTLYKNKSVVNKYPVAVGNPPSLTPSGKFRIVVKVVNPAWGGGGYTKPVKGGSSRNPLGYRWIGLSVGGGSTYGIHGNNNPYSIGTNASHGCIRMLNSDVEELFQMVDTHTFVWIGGQDTLVGWGIKQSEY